MHGDLALVGEHRRSCPSPRCRRPPKADGLLDPARRERAQDVAVGERARRRRRRRAPRATTLSAAGADRSGVSPPGQPSRHRNQSGVLLADLRRGHALVLAVVPLQEVARAAARRARGRRVARSRARARAGSQSTQREVVARERAPSSRATLAPFVGERDVGARRCAARTATTRSRRGGRARPASAIERPPASATSSQACRAPAATRAPRGSGPAITRASIGAFSAPVTSSSDPRATR